MQNQGMNREDAQRKVMDEFPQLFLRASGVAGEDVPVLQSSSQPSQPSQPSKPSKPSGSGYLPSREVQGSPEANPPRWPSSVLVLSKGSGYDVVDQIYEEMSSLDRGQFSTSRYALLFEASPKMHDVDVRVGFYTSVYGLGRHPSDTNIRSVTSTNETPHPELGSLQNFWRRLDDTFESFWSLEHAQNGVAIALTFQERRELPDELPSDLHLRRQRRHAVGGLAGCTFTTCGGG